LTSSAPPKTAKPRLLFFYAPATGASVRVDGYLAQVLQRRHNHNTFVITRIDVTRHPELAERFRVSTTPSICVVDGNRVAARAEKPRGATELQQLLRPWLR
jgi:thioredoxin-like negative regulator of GroEL